MPYTIAESTFEELADIWDDILAQSPSDTLFLTYPWQRLWWQYFSDEYQPHFLRIAHNDTPVGIAPLIAKGHEVTLLGSTAVCDYMDFILPAEHTYGGLSAAFDHMNGNSWSTAVFQSVSGGSPTLDALNKLADARGYKLSVEQEDVCPRAELPADWETYLSGLSKKDRHELRRKARRLEQQSEVRLYACTSSGADLDRDLDDFFRLHRLSRDEKAVFMTEDMADFFSSVIAELLPAGIAKLFFLEVAGVRAASALCFDYRNKRLLYNSGYDHAYAALSVGLLLKAYIIRDAVEGGLDTFDFLRGDEPYKYDLGGVDHPIYTCTLQRE